MNGPNTHLGNESQTAQAVGGRRRKRVEVEKEEEEEGERSK